MAERVVDIIRSVLGFGPIQETGEEEEEEWWWWWWWVRRRRRSVMVVVVVEEEEEEEGEMVMTFLFACLFPPPSLSS